MDTQISDLRAIAADVATYFERKLPNDKAVELWFKKLDSLNLRAAHHRIVDIITNGEAPPKNFPAAVKSAYSSWLRDQPREYQERGCDLCIGGMIHGIKDGNVYAFRCGHCNSSQSEIEPKTRYQLESQGFKLDWQHDYDGPVDFSFVKKIKNLLKNEPPRVETDPEELPF